MEYQQFAEKWGNGCGRQECHAARHVVLARGTVPCDVVFVGEAPGASEDSSGLPFEGPAGHVFHLGPGNIIAQVREMVGADFTYAMCNLVGCIPRDHNGRKTTDIPDEQIEKCAPRLLEFLEMCQPGVIVTLGELPAGWLDQSYKHCIRLPESIRRVPIVEAIHPGAILRMPTAQKSHATDRAVVVIASAIKGVIDGKTGRRSTSQ